MSINHRAEAEKYLANAARHLTEVPGDMRIAEVAAWIGQGHAVLAANTANEDLRKANDELTVQLHAMRRWVSGHIAHALVSGNPDRWKAARDLAQGLDSAAVNVDDLVDEHLADDGHDTKVAWNTPYQPGPDDPWAPKPRLDVPEPVRRVVAGHLAEALIDGENDEVRKWARGMAYELKREGLDLTDAIKKRINALTLGPDPSEPPF